MFSTGGTPEEFLKNMENFNKITWGKVNNVIKGITTVLFQQIIEDTPVAYGWTQNSWTFSLDIPSNKELAEYNIVDGFKVKKHYDKTGNVNKQRIANQVKRAPAITKKGVEQHRYYLTNNAYPAYLIEYHQHSAQARDGMVRKNIQKLVNKDVSRYAIYKPGDEG